LLKIFWYNQIDIQPILPILNDRVNIENFYQWPISGPVQFFFSIDSNLNFNLLKKSLENVKNIFKKYKNIYNLACIKGIALTEGG